MSTAIAVPQPAAGSIARQEFGASQIARQAETASTAAAAQAQAAIQARYVMALQRPRDWDEVRVRILREVERPGFADSAWYALPRGGKTIEGLSVRFAEAAARAMTNVLMDAAAIYEDADQRIVRVVVSDLETNLTYAKDVPVSKFIERKKLARGQDPVSARTNSSGETTYLVRATEDDMLAKEGALVSKAFRVGILRVLPGDLQDAARDRIRAILAGAAAKDPDALRRKIADAFSDMGVSPAELKKYLGHELAACSPAELTDLRGLHAALKSGEATWAEVLEARLGTPADEAPKPDPLAEKLRAAASPATPAAPAPPPAVEPTPTREPGSDDDEPGQATLPGAQATASHVDRPAGRRGVR